MTFLSLFLKISFIVDILNFGWKCNYRHVGFLEIFNSMFCHITNWNDSIKRYAVILCSTGQCQFIDRGVIGFTNLSAAAFRFICNSKLSDEYKSELIKDYVFKKISFTNKITFDHSIRFQLKSNWKGNPDKFRLISFD